MSTVKRNVLVVLLASIALVGLAASPAHAAIAIGNSGFETPETDLVYGWLSWDLFEESPTWVNPDITNRCGMLNVEKYMGTALAATFSGYEGAQILVLDGRVVDEHTPGSIYQNVGSVAYDSNATVTVAVGREVAGANAPGGFTIGLLKDTDADDVPDTVLASTHYETSALSIAAMTDFSVTASGVAADTNLYVKLTMDSSAETTITQTLFDNVRVSCAAVPEPGTLAILLAGMASLVCYAWRKHR